MADDIDKAVADMAVARNKAAEPLTFSEAVAAASDERTRGQLTANLPLIEGGFEAVRKGVLAASALTGELAKTLTLFQNPEATEIAPEASLFAREIAERACRLRVAKKLNKEPADVKASDGIPCAN